MLSANVSSLVIPHCTPKYRPVYVVVLAASRNHTLHRYFAVSGKLIGKIVAMASQVVTSAYV
jgi:hypothetical protein